MEPRKKLTPSPIARPTGPMRPLAPARSRSVLPTVAALLAIAAVGCERNESIQRDPVAIGHVLHTTQVAPVDTAVPSLGIIEEAPPPPAPPVATVKAKPVHPKPSPTSPPMPGGLMAVHPTT
jgi:hypothetical protein